MNNFRITGIRIGAKDVSFGFSQAIIEGLSAGGTRTYTDSELLRKGREIATKVQDCLKKDKVSDVRVECIVFNPTKNVFLVKYGLVDETFSMYVEEEVSYKESMKLLVQLYKDIEKRFNAEVAPVKKAKSPKTSKKKARDIIPEDSSSSKKQIKKK